MIRRDDQYGVQVVLFEEAAEIFVLLGRRSCPFLRPGKVRWIQIAHGGELDVGRLAHQSGDVHAAAPAADQPDPYAFVCAEDPPRREGTGRDNGAGLNHSFDELSSFHFGYRSVCEEGVLNYYAEKSSRRAQFFWERGIDSASTPAGPSLLNRFVHLCGPTPDAD